MFSASAALRKVLCRQGYDTSKNEKDSAREKGSVFLSSLSLRNNSVQANAQQLRFGQFKSRFLKSTTKNPSLECDRSLSISNNSNTIGKLSVSSNISEHSCSASLISACTLSTISAHLSLRQFRKTSAPVSPFNLSSEQLPLHPPYDGATPEFFKVIFESQDAVYSSFMRAHKCYDLIPTSTKLVVFDTELLVKKAFFALIYNGVRAAPLWDSKRQEFIGMLTITDFIRILQKYCTKNGSKNEDIEDLEKHKIATWREELEQDGHLKPLASISPCESLFQAVQVLCKEKVHRLPVMEECTGNIAFILTHKRLMKFLYLYMIDLPRPSFMEKTPLELGIGTWNNVSTITQNTPLIDIMNIFLSKRVSALPVLDENEKVVDIYAKFDAINLAANKSYTDLDITAQEALRYRVDWFEGVRCCSPDDSLMMIVEMIVRAEVHRLVVVDHNNKVTGIISLSDILRFLVLEPPVTPPGNCSPDFAMDDVIGSNDDEIYCS
ncbi:unnamed protein product [Cercopithifilaria johnstoni]|uniref:CBS domain-containing protein n=1 Tax=Cercopithifilaria johnstoni TaxID=2874296 RepID=A0A8J2MBL5_9BILA|nr:unnamed protein product [Cercopithifilaria johnstoni]